MFKNRIDPEWALARTEKHPQAVAYLKAHDFYVPDALKDNGNTRSDASEGVLKLMEALKGVSGCQALIHGELDLGSLDGRNLYSKRTHERAKALVEAHFKQVGVAAFIWKLERGRNGGTHTEVVIPADSDISGLTSYSLVETAEDEEEVAKYLCKPADAAACGPRKKELIVWGLEELEEKRLGAVDTWVKRPRRGSERLRFLRSKGLRGGR